MSKYIQPSIHYGSGEHAGHLLYYGTMNRSAFDFECHGGRSPNERFSDYFDANFFTSDNEDDSLKT
jgi:hypothetical protein